MKIECARCPARGRECGDCMMHVFFGSVTSEYVVGDVPDAEGLELAGAIAVFADTDLITAGAAEAARRSIGPGEGDEGGCGSRTLRAV